MNTAVIAVIISGVVCVVNIIAFIISRKRDIKLAITEDNVKFDGIKESLLKVNMKLDQVCATTQETRADIKAMQNQYIDIDKRVVVLERDLKTLWNKFEETKDK